MQTQSSARILHNEKDLTAGKWYAVGFKHCLCDNIDWSSAMLYRYDGEGCWSDELGEVELTLDPVLQFEVPVSDADAFAEQS